MDKNPGDPEGEYRIKRVQVPRHLGDHQCRDEEGDDSPRAAPDAQAITAAPETEPLSQPWPRNREQNAGRHTGQQPVVVMLGKNLEVIEWRARMPFDRRERSGDEIVYEEPFEKL